MSIGILGKKVGMTRIFGEKGAVIPVTVIEAGPCHIVQVKSKATDGYEAIQIGFGQKKENAINEPARGRFKKANVPPLRVLREFRLDKATDVGSPTARNSEMDGSLSSLAPPLPAFPQYQEGQQLTAGTFSVGELVDISGISKGKGFSGVMKRWGFKGGKASHGAETHRHGGSIGASADPSRVFKGMKMAGRMGGKQVTVQNLEVVKVDMERNLLVVKGSVPGPRNGVIVIRKAVKASKSS